MSKTAKCINPDMGWRGDARLYQLSEPTAYGWGEDRGTTAYVIVSAVNALGCDETYIFPATADGKALSMLEMEGSFKGEQDHAEALRGAGYEIAE